MDEIADVVAPRSEVPKLIIRVIIFRNNPTHTPRVYITDGRIHDSNYRASSTCIGRLSYRKWLLENMTKISVLNLNLLTVSLTRLEVIN